MPRPFSPPPGVRVLYTDLDGTMLGAGGALTFDPAGAATAEPAAALVAALAAGIDVVPVSGRSMPGVARDARLLGLRTSIGDMGAVTAYDYGRELVTTLGEYPGGDVPPVELMERQGAVDALIERFNVELHLPWAKDRVHSALLRGLMDVSAGNDALRELGAGWCEILDNGTLHGAYLDLPPGASHVYHVLPRGVSKGAAVGADLARRSLQRSHAVGLGDSVADLTLAPYVELMVVPVDAYEADPDLARAAEEHPNVAITERPGNLGWADAVAAVAAKS